MVILLVALLVLGPERMPDVVRTLAKMVRELRRAGDEVRMHLDPDLDLYKATHLDPNPPGNPVPNTIDSLSVSDKIEPDKQDNPAEGGTKPNDE